MVEMRKGLPLREESDEKAPVDFSERTWIRKRWRKRLGEAIVRCVECGSTLNRSDTYYVRPAYTDGDLWLCSGCYDRMTDQAHIMRDHRYGHRRIEDESE